MPQASAFGDVYNPVSKGPAMQVAVPSSFHNLPTSVAANESVFSHLIPTNGYEKIAITLKASQSGFLSVQRYLDIEGQFPQGQPIATNLIRGNTTTLNINDGMPFSSFIVNVSNISTVESLLSSFYILFHSGESAVDFTQRLLVISTTIAQGQSLGNAVNLGGLRLFGVGVPLDWTAANLTFQASLDGGATWLDMVDGDGMEIVAAAAGGKMVVLDPTKFAAITNIRLRSGSSASPVAQTATRLLSLVLRGI